MSITAVRAYLARFGLDSKVLEFPVSSATVELAAEAAGVIPARIAKSLSFKVDGEAILIVTAGDAKVDNAKFKAAFHTKAKMLTQEQAREMTGHTVLLKPENLQVTINPADVKTLKRVFGKRNVFDFNGINEYTEDIHNYYEPGHYRPALGKRLMEKIYEPYILSPNAKSPASPSPGTI